MLGNDAWRPIPVCAGGRIAKYQALQIITGFFTTEQEPKHYSYFLIVHRWENAIIIVRQNKFSNMASVEHTNVCEQQTKKKKPPLKNMDQFQCCRSFLTGMKEHCNLSFCIQRCKGEYASINLVTDL